MQTYHQEDDIVNKQYDLSLAKRLLVFANPYKGLVIFIIVLTFVLTVLGVALGPRLQGLALNELIPNAEFAADEFTGNFSVKNLCDTLRQDNFDIPNDTIDALNNLLKQDDLYEKSIATRSQTPSKELIKLKETFNKRKDEKSLNNLNRAVL
ncbi:MAG: hypothetical protein V1871_01280, partial [Planctomycetota bacterium]